jgi:cytidylate kinase
VLLDGEDVSALIRTPAMSLGASAVSARPVVRAALLDLQRRLAVSPEHRGAVLEGRDIGTVVFPDADAKVFLTASPEVRAQRRFAELQAKGDTTPFERVLAEQQRRDRDDSERAHAPLKPAPDATMLDSSELTLDQVVDRLVALVEARLSGTAPAE